MADSGTRVVAHMRDGTLIRGLTNDFRPGKNAFTVSTSPNHGRVRVPVSELKALFFVKTLGGNPTHVQSNAFDDGPRVGRRVWVVFADGEQLAGRVLSVKNEQDGFFLFPSDSGSNLERAWIVVANTRKVLYGEEATAASRGYEPDRDSPVEHIEPEKWDQMLRTKSLASPQPWDKALPLARARRESSDIFLGDW